MSTDFEPGIQMDDIDIVCPHCGHRRQAEPCDGDADESPRDEECGECGKKFVRWASIMITYYTEPKETK